MLKKRETFVFDIFESKLSDVVLCPFRVLYEGKEQLKQGWYVIETTPYSRSASLSSGGAPTAHRVFLMYRRAPDSQGLHTLGITDITLLLPSKGEVAPHTFCRVEKNLNTGMVSTGTENTDREIRNKVCLQ